MLRLFVFTAIPSRVKLISLLSKVAALMGSVKTTSIVLIGVLRGLGSTSTISRTLGGVWSPVV
ncbi:hypothetical protein [Brunnivagina elsteri]|uniref:hypothetical protein n=1 Tax=Brunnivagina elsteri TaxID=1247191 RepID=UPI001B801EDC|nr:hypothetical protein [Calothrix elsteri]